MPRRQPEEPVRMVGREKPSKVTKRAGGRKLAAKVRPAKAEETAKGADGELVILTGMSGSGKASALKAFEDLGFYSVDNLPLELLTPFAELVAQSVEITRAA